MISTFKPRPEEGAALANRVADAGHFIGSAAVDTGSDARIALLHHFANERLLETNAFIGITYRDGLIGLYIACSQLGETVRMKMHGGRIVLLAGQLHLFLMPGSDFTGSKFESGRFVTGDSQPVILEFDSGERNQMDEFNTLG